jgi:hypothetical protein
MNLTFAVLLKSAEFFQQPKGSLNYPPFGQYRKPMKFIAFHHLYFSPFTALAKFSPL